MKSGTMRKTNAGKAILVSRAANVNQQRPIIERLSAKVGSVNLRSTIRYKLGLKKNDSCLRQRIILL